MEHHEADAAALERIAATADGVVTRVRSHALTTHQDCTELWADLLVLVTEVARGGWGRVVDGTGSTLEWGEPLETEAAVCVAQQQELLRKLHAEGRVYEPDRQPTELIVQDSVDLLSAVLMSSAADPRDWAASAYDQFLTELPHLTATIAFWLDAFEPTTAGLARVREPVAAG